MYRPTLNRYVDRPTDIFQANLNVFVERLLWCLVETLQHGNTH